MTSRDGRWEAGTERAGAEAGTGERERGRSRFWRRVASVPLIALATCAATTTVRAETMVAKFIRIDPEPTTDEKIGTPIIPMLVELAVPVPINSFSAECTASGSHAKVNVDMLKCMSSRIEKEGYAKQFEFPKDNARLFNIVDGRPNPMDIVDTVPFKEATASNAGNAWLILMDASSSVGDRWGSMQETAEALVKALGEHDAVMIRIMDDKVTREHTKWLGASGKQSAINLIRKVTRTYASGSSVDTLIGRIEKEAVGSFQDLMKSGVEGADADVLPILQTVVVLSDGGDTSAASFGGGAEAKVIHEKLVNGELGIIEGMRTPIPVVSVWFPKNRWGGIAGIEDQYRNNEYQWMSNIATTEVGGYFDIIQDGEVGKGTRVARVVRARFDNMSYISAKAACLDTTGEQTFKLAFEDTKSKIIPATWSKVPIAFNFTKWLLAVDKKKTEDAANKKPLQPGETFEVYGDFCWGDTAGAAEAYFVTEADAADVKKAASDKTGKEVKKLLQNLSAKGQKAETVSASPIMARFKVPNAPQLFENKGDSFTLNVVVLDNKALRGSARDKNGLLLLRSTKPPINKLLIVGAIGGGVVLILLIAILARSGGGGGRQKRRKGGTPPTPGPVPGQPPGPSPVAQRAAEGSQIPAPSGAPMSAPVPVPRPAWSPANAQPPRPPPPAAPGYPPPAAPAYPPATAGPARGGPALPYTSKAATSFPITCPNPSCGRQVLVPPGGTAQCAFCGTMVDARGAAVAPIPAPGSFGLTGAVDEGAAARAAVTGTGGRGGTIALQSPAVAAAREPRAVALNGAAGSFRVLPLVESRVGRDGSLCSIALDEPRVSGVHATLKVEQGTLLVRDDRSHNGTYVNGNRIAPGTWIPVPGGSQLRFGPIEFVVRHEP